MMKLVIIAIVAYCLWGWYQTIFGPKKIAPPIKSDISIPAPQPIIPLSNPSYNYPNSVGTYYNYENSNDIYQDITHSASVDYYNPNTGFTNSYTLDVDVEDGQLVKIHFPNGGYLDATEIDPADIDENGNVTVTDSEGREFSVKIDDYETPPEDE